MADLKEALGKSWTIQATGGGGLAIEENNSRIYIHLDSIEQNAPVILDYFIDYSDIELVKKVVETIANSGNVLVDNDFGTVLRGDQFVKRMKAEPGWNWRNDHH